MCKLVATLDGLGRRVDRVATAGDGWVGKLLEPAWNAVRNQAPWDFVGPSRSQERLSAAAMSSLGCVVLSGPHHLLKVLRYRALTDGVLASLKSQSSPGWLMTFTCGSWTAVNFRELCQGNEPAGKLGEGLTAVLLAWWNWGRICTAMRVRKEAFEAAL
jgi:hypothetical protein